MNQDSSTIKEQVIQYIKENSIEPTPRWHFVFAVIATVIVTVLLSLLASIAISVIIFRLRFSGIWYVMGFGKAGVLPFLMVFPWTWALVTLLAIYAADKLLQRFRFVYRKNIVLFFCSTSLLVLGCGLLVERMRIHDKLVNDEESFRHMNPLYGDVDNFPKEGIIVGRVIGLSSQSALLKTRSNQEIMIFIRPDTLNSFGTYAVGDVVVTVGQWQNNSLEAYGIRRTFSNFPGFPK